MMLYFFVKRGENCEMHGVDCAEIPQEVQSMSTELQNAGAVSIESSEYEAQLLNGAKAGMVAQSELDAANAKIAELEGKIAEAAPKE